ncbi:transposase [Flavobacterium sp. XN-5]|nr:transposase [Flavobacterium sp. XN-5]
MRKSKFRPEQIAKILKEFENGKSVLELSREHGLTSATFYKWRERYAGLKGSAL